MLYINMELVEKLYHEAISKGDIEKAREYKQIYNACIREMYI